ncbi:MAG TPA: NAD(P)H-dependent glycerol-3-phosphate dehydrogenase [Porticoccaceae bacterium]
MSSTPRIAVLGGGSFGTAIANMIARKGYPVTLWMRDAANAERCRNLRENTPYLPGYPLHESLHISSDMAEALDGAEVVFFSIPSKSFRQVVRSAAPLLAPGVMAVSTAKGIEEDSFDLMSEILLEELEAPRVGVISGPNLAREIAAGEITATVIASEDNALCQRIQALLGSSSFRVYANHDRYGVELAGALKNIYAIVAGIASAMGVGQNTLSVLITRSLAEMTRFAARLGANPMTFLGLSGVGDLIVTCTSPLSRNFRVGQCIGKGMSLDEAMVEVGQVAEGIKTTRIVKHKADAIGVYMPLVSALDAILFHDQPLQSVLKNMMSSEQTEDVEFRVMRSNCDEQ